MRKHVGKARGGSKRSEPIRKHGTPEGLLTETKQRATAVKVLTDSMDTPSSTSGPRPMGEEAPAIPGDNMPTMGDPGPAMYGTVDDTEPRPAAGVGAWEASHGTMATANFRDVPPWNLQKNMSANKRKERLMQTTSAAGTRSAGPVLLVISRTFSKGIT